jgi:chromosome segregation ATPase
MTQTPITVTYSLEEVLARIEKKIDERFSEVSHKFDEVNHKFDGVNHKLDDLQKDVNNLKVGQARLEEKVNGLGKRLENQEFISRGVLIALIVAILGGFAKLFGFVGNP